MIHTARAPGLASGGTIGELAMETTAGDSTRRPVDACNVDAPGDPANIETVVSVEFASDSSSRRKTHNSMPSKGLRGGVVG